MAQRAWKFKPFPIRPALLFLLSALLLETISAHAATLDFPVFPNPERWIYIAKQPLTALPPAERFSREERVAAETILLEAAGDGFASMVAVGETIRNRRILFKKNAEEVCLQPFQFSGWNDRARAARFLESHRRFYGRAWLAWQLSAATRLTAGATDYHTQDIVPYWAASYTAVSRVGSHIFYIRQARRIRAE